MKQFIDGGASEFRDLESRARTSCVVFRDEPMPPGTQPTNATVGFEVNPADGKSMLLVKGVSTYTGSNDEVRRWFREGRKQFPSFGDLRRWIQVDLAACYVVQPRPVGNPGDLTDLETIRMAVSNKNNGVVFEPDALLQELQAEVRGQDGMLALLAGRVCRHLARKDPARPLTAFAIGPTGVGKTN